jgi:hypothetical protein
LVGCFDPPRRHGTGRELLDGVESRNHAAGRRRLTQLPDDVEGHADTRSATARPPATARFCCSSRPFPQREMAFNSYTSFAVWASNVVRGTKSVAGLLKFPA